MPTKIEFEIVNHYFDVIADLATDANDFCQLWMNYLSSVGWTEDEFFAQLEKESDETLN